MEKTHDLFGLGGPVLVVHKEMEGGGGGGEGGGGGGRA